MNFLGKEMSYKQPLGRLTTNVTVLPGLFNHNELIFFLWLIFHCPQLDFSTQFVTREDVELAGKVCPVWGSASLISQTNLKESHMKERINLQLLSWEEKKHKTGVDYGRKSDFGEKKKRRSRMLKTPLLQSLAAP